MSGTRGVVMIAAWAVLSCALCGCGNLLDSNCGSGGNTGSSSSTADFSGEWQGSLETTGYSYSIQQSGRWLGITCTAPDPEGRSYRATISGKTASVTEYANGNEFVVSTWTKLNDTTITVEYEGCVERPGYSCPPVGATLTLKRDSSAPLYSPAKESSFSCTE